MKFILSLITLGLLLCAGKTPAADIQTLLDEASSLIVRDDAFHALPLLKRATMLAWEQSEPRLLVSALVEEKASGYGQYNRREHSVYQPSERIHLYLEPVGYKFRLKDGQYSFGYTADFSVLSDDGTPLGGQKNFQHWTFSSRYPLFESYLSIAYRLRGVAPGNYQIKTTLHDINSPNSISFSKHIEIRLPTAPEPDAAASR
jgi:hypothetical protein